MFFKILLELESKTFRKTFTLEDDLVLKTPKALRVIGWTIGIAIVLYLIALLAFYRFQDKIIRWRATRWAYER